MESADGLSSDDADANSPQRHCAYTLATASPASPHRAFPARLPCSVVLARASAALASVRPSARTFQPAHRNTPLFLLHARVPRWLGFASTRPRMLHPAPAPVRRHDHPATPRARPPCARPTMLLWQHNGRLALPCFPTPARCPLPRHLSHGLVILSKKKRKKVHTCMAFTYMHLQAMCMATRMGRLHGPAAWMAACTHDRLPSCSSACRLPGCSTSGALAALAGFPAVAEVAAYPTACPLQPGRLPDCVPSYLTSVPIASPSAPPPVRAAARSPAPSLLRSRCA